MSKNKAKVFDIRQLPRDLGRIFFIIMWLFFRPRLITTNGEKYRKKIRGGALIVANHSSFSDPIALGSAFFYRRLSFLTAKEAMDKPLRRVLMRTMGCIEIDRSINDINAIRQSVKVLSNGRPLAVFPEGRINREDGMNSIKSGAALLSLKAGVPIIPVYSIKQKSVFMRRVFVVGEAIINNNGKKMPKPSDIERVSAMIKDELERCKAAYDVMTEAK